MKTALSNPFACIAALATAGLAMPAAALTLFDPSLATLPTAQGWQSLGTGIAPSQSFVGGRLRLDTQTDPDVTQFVHYRSPPPAQPLDTVAGFTLSFALQVVSEAHQSANRAGYSLLVQGVNETKALELSFWADEVWAISYSPGGADSGYLHGNGFAIDTTAALRNYALTVQNNAYTLLADGNVILTGLMTDYPVQGLSTLPYGFSNTVFMGDNSSRGQSITELGLVSITAVPEPGVAWLLAAGLAGLALRRRLGTC